MPLVFFSSQYEKCSQAVVSFSLAYRLETANPAVSNKLTKAGLAFEVRWRSIKN